MPADLLPLREGELPLLFRYGFICYPSAEAPRGDAVWKAISRLWQQTRVGGFTIHTHPETPVLVHNQAGQGFIQIGHAFPAGQAPYADLPESFAAAASEEEALNVLDCFSGRFAFLVITNDGGRVFHDAFGARSIFYLASGVTALSSHANLLAHAFRIRPRRDMLRLIDSEAFRSGIRKYPPGDNTLLKNVYALIPNHYYDIADRRSVRYWPRSKRISTDFDIFFDTIDEYFRGFSEFLDSFHWTAVLGVTGGIDSRTLMAGFRHFGVRPVGVTWLERNFKTKERPVVDELVRHLGLTHHYAMSSRDSRAALIGRHAAGGYRVPQSHVGGMLGLYNDYRNPTFIRGHGAGMIRGHYQHRREHGPMEDLSAGEMARLYRLGVKGRFRDNKSYVDATNAAFQGFVSRGNFESLGDFGFSPDDLFYWEHRMGTWGSAVLNETDPVVFSLVGYNSRKVYEMAFGLPDEQRLSKTLLLEVIRRYDPNLAVISYF